MCNSIGIECTQYIYLEMEILSIITAIIGALLGGYFGALYQYRFQNRKLSKIRSIAIKALDIFVDYAKNNQTYDMASAEFNNSLDVVEKRAVLVALCKLGIPVVQPIDEIFNIENVKFEKKVICKDVLELMKGQVNKGNCDDMFFSDVDAYFSSNTRLLAVRAVAKKYVDMDYSKCKCDLNNMVVNHPLALSEQFTPGELNILNVFRARSCWPDYFDKNGNAIPKKMEELKKEIDLGLWDTYLFWDWESYQNMQNQNSLAVEFTNMMHTNMQQVTNHSKDSM